MGRDIAGEREMRRTHGRRVSGLEALVVEGEQRRLLLTFSIKVKLCYVTYVRWGPRNVNLKVLFTMLKTENGPFPHKYYK